MLAVAPVAAAAADGCFSRTYSSEHLAGHSKQRITAAALRVSGTKLALRLTLRGPKDSVQTLGYCNTSKPATCKFEGDGGTMTLLAKGSGAEVRFQRFDYESNTFGALDTSPKADGLLRLNGSPAAACAGLTPN
jgi:hypothetical protein